MPTQAQGSSSQPFGYTGERWDAETGFVYLRARYYDPATGRFLHRDPFKGLARKPNTLHPYAYAGNNPATMRDPSGEFAINLAAAVIGAVVGGAIAGVQAYTASGGDTGKVIEAAFIGAVAGALTGVTLGALGTVALSAVAGAGANAATQAAVMHRAVSELDWGSIAFSAASGVVGGFAGSYAMRWMGASTSTTANWIRTNSWGFDDEAIAALVSGVFAGGSDLALQWGWEQREWLWR